MGTARKKSTHRRPAKVGLRKVPAHRVRQACRAAAASLVCQVAANWSENMRLSLRQIAAEAAPMIEKERLAWQEETGRAMPNNTEEMMQAAIELGRSRGLPASHEWIGQYTLADIYEMQAQGFRQRRDIAKAIVEEMASTDRASLVDPYQRAADAMSSEARRVVVALLADKATKCTDAMTRDEIAKATRLTDRQVKAVMEVELRRVAAQLNADITDAKPSHGTWLTPEGVEIAKRIPSDILKK